MSSRGERPLKTWPPEPSVELAFSTMDYCGDVPSIVLLETYGPNTFLKQYSVTV